MLNDSRVGPRALECGMVGVFGRILSIIERERVKCEKWGCEGGRREWSVSVEVGAAGGVVVRCGCVGCLG